MGTGIRYIVLVATIFLSIIARSQQADYGEIKSQFQQYREKVLQEKIYAHLDKNLYLAGEILWFKIYNVDASLHKPLDISKVVYVEILDQDHNAVLQTKLSLKDGTGHGSLVLPQTLNSGNYFFRAYTNWMKNFDADFFFEKNISIINSLKSQLVNSKNVSAAYDVQFFPEGGNLVEGIESVVGVRTVNQYGIGDGFKGIVLNQSNDTISHFESLKFGIGSFSFHPQPNNQYRAMIQLADGNIFTKELPKVYGQGYVLHLAKKGGAKLQLKIKTSSNFNNQTVYLLVHTRQQLVESRSLTISSNEAEFLIDEEKLGDGISHFTLFDSNKNPVCERLFFKRPTQQLLINAVSDLTQYESRRKVTIDIDTKTESGNQQAANMSLSVYRFDSAFYSSEQNIISYLWLSSDLKGNVESPGYYFENIGEEADKALDNLMLTHGWRRFNWQSVLQTKNFAFSYIPEYEGHIVAGTVINAATGQPAKNVHSFLSVPDSNFHFYNGLSDDNGNVHFYTKNFFGEHEIVAQAGARERAYRINIKSPFFEKYSSRSLPAFSLADFSGATIQAISTNMQVQNIYVGDKQNKISPLPPDTTAFFTSSRIYRLDDYVRFPTMEEVLREYVQEVAVIKQHNKLFLEVGRRDADGIVYRYEPLVLIDGVPLFDDPNKVFSFDPLRVKELQIMNKRYFLGAATFEGILNFKTYLGRPEGLSPDPNATVLDYEALQQQREFFTPVYETQNQVNSRLPDFRSLLHWEPSVKTNQQGKQQISFYTSDLAGKYMVMIEGLSVDGRAGTKTFSINVVNPLFVQK